MGLNKGVRPNIGLTILVFYMLPDINIPVYVGFTFIFLLTLLVGAFIIFITLLVFDIEDIFIPTTSLIIFTKSLAKILSTLYLCDTIN